MPKPVREPLTFPAPAEACVAPADFLEACNDLGVAFDDGDLARLGIYLDLLLRTNKIVNLTAVKEEHAAWTRHVFDALTLLPLLQDLPENARIADVGSGGGLPGIPLAICLPSMHVTLIEATGKKAAFLQHVAAAMGLTNVSVVNDRAETIGQMGAEHRDSYDVVIARAVGRMAVLAELTMPLARPARDDADDGGLLLLIKGERAEEELDEARQALHKLHAEHVTTMQTPTGRIVVLRKRRRTPRIYPRRAGEPKRDPLR
ncbi:MAG: 16S rRNA (guanine(527)-N(7))-methyltransferase RsmG [Planctomycetota bacterium]